jgi:EmrB/QacA subfamily drug resistance transporter
MVRKLLQTPVTSPTGHRETSVVIRRAFDRSPATNVFAACLAIFCAYVPLTSIAVALPTIQTSLGASSSQLTWVLDALVVPMAAVILISGTLADLLGRRRLLLGGLTLVGAGAVIGLFAHSSIGLLWASDAVIGTGAGMLLPSSLAVISNAIRDPHRRGHAIGAWASSIGIGLAAGPWLTSLIIDSLGASWTWLYAAPLPFIAVAIILTLLGVEESRAHEGRGLDLPGQLTAALLVVALVFGVIEGPDHGWGSALVVTSLAIAAAALLTFLVVEHRSRAPMLDLRLFSSRDFSVTSLVALLLMFGLIGSVFLLSLFFGTIQHLSLGAVALRFVMITGAIVLAGPLAAVISRRVGAVAPLTAGLVLAAAGLLSLTAVDPNTGLGDLWWRMVAIGVGFGFVLAPMTSLAVACVPHALAGLAGSANNAFRQIGAALGPAVLGAVLIGRLKSSLPAALSAHHVDADTSMRVGQLVGKGGLQALRGLPSGPASAHVMAAGGDAFASALHTAMTVAGGALLLAALAALFLLRPRPEHAGRPEATSDQDLIRAAPPVATETELVAGGAQPLSFCRLVEVERRDDGSCLRP